jgi:hypothetical protein
MERYKRQFEEAFRPNFKNAHDFVNYLLRTLIPDLKKSGMDATAEDFQEAIFWITKAINGKLK